MKFQEYKNLEFKKPIESGQYKEYSDSVLNHIAKIIQNRIATDTNKIMINTNLKLGLPMENINKIAGPIVEAWAYEVFSDTLQDPDNIYQLINVEACERLNMTDIILQFKIQSREHYGVTANVDVKATSDDIKGSGKSPNITSFARIRTMYIKDPDYLFIILSLKHKVYSKTNNKTFMMDAIMEIVSYNCYDLKYISEKDISYNPALGTGQIQIRDIHYVDIVNRNTWDFCQLLDSKFIKSKNGFTEWLILAKKYEWIKQD
jgi:hypothetical protein